jgi:hypothetical protein
MNVGRTIALGCAVLLTAATGFADGPTFVGPAFPNNAQVAQSPVIEPIPMPGPGYVTPLQGEVVLPPGAEVPPGAFGGQPMVMPGIEVYRDVKYRRVRNIAPCAVPMIVSVKDPCASRSRCNACGPQCVNVEICVPPGACPCIKSNRDGSRVCYRYGRYSVQICSRPSGVVVSYAD